MENDLNEKKNSYNNIKYFGFYNGGGLLLNMAFVYNYTYLLNDTMMWGFFCWIQLGVQFYIWDELQKKDILIKKLNDDITTIKNFKIE
jgi:hypothetical protein